MTPTTKPVIRVSSERFNRREVVVIVGPGALIGFRLKGTPRTWETTIGACYSLAVKQQVTADKARKAAERKARRAL